MGTAPRRGRVALTGATGFIGAPLTTALDAAGWELRVLARREPPLLRTSRIAEVIVGDLGDEKALRQLVDGVDAVVHLAGLVKARSTSEFFRVNAEGTERLVRAAAALPNPPRFLLVSSLAAREPQLSGYCASKRGAEEALRREAGAMGWMIVRPPAVYGPGDLELLPFFRNIQRGLAPRPSGGQHRVSMIYISDLVDFIAKSLEKPIVSQICWEIDDGTPEGYSWTDLATTAAAILGMKPRRVALPRAVVDLVARRNEAAMRRGAPARMLSRGKVRELFHEDWVAHSRPPEDATAWRPHWPLARGMAETIEWYRFLGNLK
jgi:nucleoside-diphosphate-sugar epimerase